MGSTFNWGKFLSQPVDMIVDVLENHSYKSTVITIGLNKIIHSIQLITPQAIVQATVTVTPLTVCIPYMSTVLFLAHGNPYDKSNSITLTKHP